MTGPSWQALGRFVDELRRLRWLAGSPSLDRLVELAAGLPRPLARSTISDKLNARSVPDWDFVASFITACRQHAEQTGVRLPSGAVDLTGWDTAHLRMLQAIDEARADQRLVVAVRAELRRRAGRADPYASRLAGPPTRDLQAVLPRQVPVAVRHFVGRTAELATLSSLVEQQASTGGPVVISAIDGMAGIGKTALAVYWAHQVADRFPDGQLYVNLRGFDPSGALLDPAEAVRGFLEALGVASARIPATLDARAALYRSVLADRRILVVLDNARDADQVRPLLPAASGCLAVVTSRNQLASLVAAEGAHPLTLDLLTSDEAGDLLSRRLGPNRVAAEPDAVRRLIAACARLPLAVAIVAAHAAIRPKLPLSDLADQLHDRHGRLGTLSTGDASTDIRAVFSWSYRRLSPDAARLFRLLGAGTGRELTISATASLTGLTPTQVWPPLAELIRANLMAEPASGRYTQHDLLHAYAAEIAHTDVPDAERGAAIHRLLDHYLHTSHEAARLLHPHRDMIILAPPRPGVTRQDLADHDQAMAWLIIEHRALLAAIELADAAGFDTHTWQLAWSLTTFLDRRGHWHDLITAQTAALAAARQTADRPGQAYALRILARAHLYLGRHSHAHAHLRQALDLYSEIADHTGQAHTHVDIGNVFDLQGRHQDALEHALRARDRYRITGHRAGQADALNNIGWYQTQLGDHAEAVAHCEQSLELHQALGNRPGEASAWDSLGYAHHHLGHHDQAIACYRHALAIYRDLGARYTEAAILTHLGDAQHTAGDTQEANTTWQQALDILTELDHPDADQLRAKCSRTA